jgi:uncharacterized protein
VIDLRRLPTEGLRLEGTTERLDLEGGAALRDLDWAIFLMPSDKDLFVEVKGKGTWEGACARCNEPIDRPLRLESQFLGSADKELVERGSHALGSQDLDVVFLPETVLDEAVLVREQFELQAPMSPLCKEDCQGLCPQCGKNWNKGKCTCSPEAAKPPSALARALAGLKLDLPK